MSALRQLAPETRATIASALESGRIAAPFSELALRRYVGGSLVKTVVAELERLSQLGMTAAHIREVIRVLDRDPAASTAHIVWSGPEDAGAETRDTGVVVRELFEHAERSVLVAGFAVYQGKSVFKLLAERMTASPELDVRMFLNVERKYKNTSLASELLREFADDFRRKQWPGKRLPHVFYDPRTLELDVRGKKRAALHAKCVVVDDRRALVTSANFTEAAQERNIEVGVLIEDPSMCRALREQFDRLVAGGHLVRVPSL